MSNENEQLISEHKGSLFYLTTIACHLPLPFWHARGQSAEWAMLI